MVVLYNGECIRELIEFFGTSISGMDDIKVIEIENQVTTKGYKNLLIYPGMVFEHNSYPSRILEINRYEEKDSDIGIQFGMYEIWFSAPEKYELDLLEHVAELILFVLVRMARSAKA